MVAKATLEKFVERATRLYEQERGMPDGLSALGKYVRRWNGWVKGGLNGHLTRDLVPVATAANNDHQPDQDQPHPE